MQEALATKTDNVEATLLATVAELARELRTGGSQLPVTLDSSFDRDLGLDSLARVELVARVAERFGVDLPETALAATETPRDLLRALAAARRPFAPARALRPIPALPEAEPVPYGAQTLLEALAWHAQRHPDRVHIRLLEEAGESAITYAELQQEAQAIAAGLQRLDVEPGQAIALMLPTSRAYFTSFFGVLLAGAVPVPIYPPTRASQLEDHVRRHRGILTNALARALITVPETKLAARVLRAQVPTLAHILTPAELVSATERLHPCARRAVDTAFLQYTSGSTGNPKGVVLTHANLLANIRATGESVAVTSKDVFVSWLPLYHDMGLIGAWFAPLYYAIPLVVMSPLAFLSRPSRWLRAIEEHGGTLSASPNFGFELCLRRVGEGEIEGLDLRSLRVVFNGAEAVSPATVERFCARFARYGFRRQAMMPVYGLAENSLALAFPPLGRGPMIDRIERHAFAAARRARPAALSDASALRFVACGRAIRGHEIRVVDESARELPDRQEGVLQFRGPSATTGYFRNVEATRKLFVGDWLDSGDLAYIADGDVYVTGRRKDLIIHAGRHVYPDEIEDAVGDLPGIRKGRVAVFGSADAASGTERLVVLAETRVEDRRERGALIVGVNSLVLSLTGTAPDDVCLAPPQTILKTSSGKLRRTACRELYEQGAVGRAPRSATRQLFWLATRSALPSLRRLLARAAELGYAAYAWAAFALFAPITWALVMILPQPRPRGSVLRAAARAFVRVCGIRVVVHGRENLLPSGRAGIYVANHSSYIDSLALVAVLPPPVGFVAKAELRRSHLVGRFLTRIGTEFVERFEPARSIEDARRLVADACDRRLLFFPEGTFTRAPGLLPFHLGAFVTAAEARLPIVPITLRGTRSILRGDSWFPRRGAITVTIAPAIEPEAWLGAPESDAWTRAVHLRDAARREILQTDQEPDLADVAGPPVAPARSRGSNDTRESF